MKVGIFVPAYEASQTLEDVIRRIPDGVHVRAAEILIQDDFSYDNTYAIAQQLAKMDPKITVIRNSENLGYGGTQKKAYKYFMDRDYDAVVMLHGDAQYAPEYLPIMLRPILDGYADIVLGSRILGDPLAGGMPRYKLLGNKILTALTNACLQLRLTDYHTGYVAFTMNVLRSVSFETCSNGHPISTEILIRAARNYLRIVEVPIPTYYGAESRSITLQTSIKYGINVIGMLARELVRKT